MTDLWIPDNLPDDPIGAAIAYANAGFYVAPIDQAVKHAGSVLGKHWPAKTSRDPMQIADWYTAHDHGIALHLGRSGAVGFDVDNPDQLPADLARYLADPAVPYQETRTDDPGHGHYLFAVPAGRLFGNSTGDLGKAWGEVRGNNGIIVVQPTVHAKHDEGGHYQWIRTGPLPLLPDDLADKLRPPAAAKDATVTDATVGRWLAAHSTGTNPDGANAILAKYRRGSAAGSRYETLRDCLYWAAKEINAGLLPAEPVLIVLGEMHKAAMLDSTNPRGADPKRAVSDFPGLLSSAVGQALVTPFVDGRTAPTGLRMLDDWRAEHAPAPAIDETGTDKTDETGTDNAPPETSVPDPFTLEVNRKAHDLRVLDEARALNARRKADTGPLPAFIGLDEFLQVPDERVRYRIDRLWPIGGRIIIAAPYKAGKSTLGGNLVRNLADGDVFLDEFAVTRPEGTVVIIDNELDERTLRIWLREQGVRHPERVKLLSLRGRVGTFDILDPTVRARWVEALVGLGTAVLIFDCLRPVLDALGLSEDKDAGRFLVAFDALLLEAGIGEAGVVHHMGHNGERSRGDSRLRDWPDAEWRIVRQGKAGEDADPTAERFFSAFGRDVDVYEGALTIDSDTRHLTYSAGSRKAARAADAVAAALPDVLALLAERPLLSGNQIESAELPHGQKAIRAAVKLGAERGDILSEHGPRGPLYYPNPSTSSPRHTSSQRSDELRHLVSIDEVRGEGANEPEIQLSTDEVDPA